MTHFLAALAHLGQGVTLLALGIVYRHPIFVQNRYPTGSPGSVVIQTATFETLPVAVAAAVLLMSSLYHAMIVMSAWGQCGSTVADPEKPLRTEKRNWWRWLHYAGTSVALMLDVCLITGVIDLTALIAVAGCNVAMIMFGDLSERVQRNSEWKVAFGYGTLVGLVPWACIFLQFGRNAATVGGAAVGAEVYAIIFTMLFLMMCFGWLEWSVINPDRKKTCLAMGGGDPLVNAEYVRTVLSLITNTLLGWLTYIAVRSG
jgi:hypothetical protein